MVVSILAVLGLCFGSFINALVWRLHEQSKPKKKRAVPDKDLSVTTGRSMCPTCQHTLAWYDLLPVLSWLSLRGKCRYCHKLISWQYPLVEILTAVLFIVSFLYFPLQLTTYYLLLPIWLAILVGFIALAVYDMRWMILPDRIVFPLQALAAIYVLAAFAVSKADWQVLSGALLGVVFGAGLFYLLFQVSGGKWIGGGDVKLAVVLGLVLGGAAEALLMIFIASAIGSLIGIPLLLAGKTKLQGKLPFGPLLIAATIIVYLFGTTLIAWYKHHLLLV